MEGREIEELNQMYHELTLNGDENEDFQGVPESNQHRQPIAEDIVKKLEFLVDRGSEAVSAKDDQITALQEEIPKVIEISGQVIEHFKNEVKETREDSEKSRTLIKELHDESKQTQTLLHQLIDRLSPWCFSQILLKLPYNQRRKYPSILNLAQYP